jgi:hypothetical protein
MKTEKSRKRVTDVGITFRADPGFHHYKPTRLLTSHAEFSYKFNKDIIHAVFFIDVMRSRVEC